MATCAASVDQTSTRPVSGAPDASRTSAVSCVVCPTTTLLTSGERSMLATGTGATVMDANALRPSEDALMMAPPDETAVTSPPFVTVATLALLVDQVMVLPGST